MMLEGLNTGRPLLGIGKAKVRKGPRVQRKKKNESNGDCGENECKTGCKNEKTSESRAEDVPMKASGDSCEKTNSWIDNKSEDRYTLNIHFKSLIWAYCNDRGLYCIQFVVSFESSCYFGNIH